MAIPWGAIAGAASAIGGLFGGDDEEEQVQTQSVDYKAMVKAAQKAGFNPLTALRNGGAAGFTTTTMPAMSSPSTLDRISNAVGSFAQGMDNQQRWDAAQYRAGLENKMIEAQTQRLRAPTTGPSGGGLSQRPQWQPGTNPGVGTPGGTGGSPTSPAGAPIPNWLVTISPEGEEFLQPNPEVPSEAEQDLWWWAKRGVFWPEVEQVFEKNTRPPKTIMQEVTDHLTGTNPFPNTPGSTNEHFYRFFQDTLPGYWQGVEERWDKVKTYPIIPRQPRAPLKLR